MIGAETEEREKLAWEETMSRKTELGLVLHFVAVSQIRIKLDTVKGRA